MSATRSDSGPSAERVVAQTPRRSPEAVIQHLSPAEHAQRGKAARERAPRRSHATWEPPGDRRDPIELLEEQATTRVPELVPIRYGRMLVSPFAFYRGGAYIMASDLAHTPDSGLIVQACGDAHLANFGGFASPERRMVFDMNDFDETLPGPWEWDVKRLVASFEIAGRDRGFSEEERRTAVLRAAASYREAMREFAEMRTLDVWYSHVELESVADKLQETVGKKGAHRFERNLAKARTKDSMRALNKLTECVDGKWKIISSPPLVVPVSELVPAADLAAREDSVRHVLREYRSTLQNDRRMLVESFEYADMARKVVGVGSVGTRAWILLMLGRDAQDPLFLQVKEAQASVLEGFHGASSFKNHGQRVVEGQRLMQATSDIFLGWIRTTGIDGVDRDFYVRQLWDWKASADLENIQPGGFTLYAKLCGWTLARAHARSGDRIAIAAYLGSTDAFDEAVAEFAVTYADQNERDYQALVDAVQSGRLEAQEA